MPRPPSLTSPLLRLPFLQCVRSRDTKSLQKGSGLPSGNTDVATSSSGQLLFHYLSQCISTEHYGESIVLSRHWGCKGKRDLLRPDSRENRQQLGTTSEHGRKGLREGRGYMQCGQRRGGRHFAKSRSEPGSPGDISGEDGQSIAHSTSST